MTQRELRATPPILYILLSLAVGPRHGYAILTEVEQRSRGQVQLGPSSLYYTLGRLEDAGLIREDEGSESPETDNDPHESQRKYFAITDAGLERLRTELSAITHLVDHARSIGLSVQG